MDFLYVSPCRQCCLAFNDAVSKANSTLHYVSLTANNPHGDAVKPT